MQAIDQLLLVGAGKMGGALLSGWLARGVEPHAVTVVEPNADSARRLEELGVRLVAAPEELPADYRPQLILFAIKPQQMAEALPAYRRFAEAGTIILTIAAGKTVAFFEEHLGKKTAVVRAMPNTPAAVGRGMSVLTANAQAGKAARELASDLMAAVGEIAWVEEEVLLDAVTAVSGGGPAYVFLLIETLAEAGREAGLPADLAMRIARATVAGAGELVYRSEEQASTLRENVTSPGGTTLEALNILMAENGLQPLMTKAIAAATRRSRDLAS